jgi:phosphatidate cytidylyltransferase
MVLGLFIPVSTFFYYRYNFEVTKKMELLFIVLAMLALILMQFKRRNNSGVIVDISTTLFGILYISWFFSFLIKIRCLQGGLGFLAAVLLITKLGDIGAYFIGTRFGKTPLLPRISPKKTVEGAIAGLFFSVLGALISKSFLNLSYLEMVLLGVSLGILGQLGDLSESLIKRDCQVKDSGNILPGMGGMLDEIDSLLFTAPAFYFFVTALIVK